MRDASTCLNLSREINRQDLAVSKFLSGLSLSLRSQVRGQILGGDNISNLNATFSRVIRVSTGADVTTAPSVEQSVVTFECGRGRDCGIDVIL